MNCPNCGAEIKENALFCGKCGTKVSETDNVTDRNRQEKMVSMLLHNPKVLSVGIAAIALLSGVIVLSIVVAKHNDRSKEDSSSDRVAVSEDKSADNENPEETVESDSVISIDPTNDSEDETAEKYNRALEALENDDYETAITLFTELSHYFGGYKDSVDRLKAAKAGAENIETYNNALAEYENGNYDSAANLFTSLGDFKDSASKLAEIQQKQQQLAEEQQQLAEEQQHERECLSGNHTWTAEGYCKYCDLSLLTPLTPENYSHFFSIRWDYSEELSESAYGYQPTLIVSWHKTPGYECTLYDVTAVFEVKVTAGETSNSKIPGFSDVTEQTVLWLNDYSGLNQGNHGHMEIKGDEISKLSIGPGSKYSKVSNVSVSLKSISGYGIELIGRDRQKGEWREFLNSLKQQN